ncbi:MAG: mechanosensitive ion channel [Candidatus Binatia bacterium]
MQENIDRITQLVVTYLPNLLGALAILIIGWLVALVVSAIVRSGLQRTQVITRITGKEAAEGSDAEQWIGKGVFYLIMLFVLVAFFQALGLTLLTEPLNRLLNQVFQFAPQLFAAGLLLLIAWIVASGLRRIILGALNVVRLDERLGTPLAKTMSEAMYWLVFLLFLPAILGSLAMEGLLLPVQQMLNKFLAFLPNLFAAGLLLGVGWFIARIVQRIVTNLLAAVGTDQLSERMGLAGALGQQGLSGLVGLIVYVMILIPVLIAALNALELEAVTVPASQMLNSILSALPPIFAAVLVLTISYMVGRLVSDLITNVLAGAGFNSLPNRLGLAGEPQQGEKTLSQMVGYLVLVAIMLFATTEAFRLLGFAALVELLGRFMVFAGQIVMGLVILAIGLYLANLASRAVQASAGAQATLLALVARISILVLVGAMGLRQMGLANEIINLAFGLLLGAIAIAVAIAFGLGGRDIAARELGSWIESIRSKKS